MYECLQDYLPGACSLQVSVSVCLYGDLSYTWTEDILYFTLALEISKERIEIREEKGSIQINVFALHIFIDRRNIFLNLLQGGEGIYSFLLTWHWLMTLCKFHGRSIMIRHLHAPHLTHRQTIASSHHCAVDPVCLSHPPSGILKNKRAVE